MVTLYDVYNGTSFQKIYFTLEFAQLKLIELLKNERDDVIGKITMFTEDSIGKVVLTSYGSLKK
jgi:hypothetical protein